MKKDYTIFVSSCDAYEDLWQPFFFFLKKNWPEAAERRIVLNTESKSCTVEGLHIDTFGLYKNGETPTWSERMAAHLQRIDSEYIVILLDDFFLEAPVDEAKIAACLAAMQQDKKIVQFGFVPTLWENVKDNRFMGFEKRPRNAPFRVNTQAGLWRRKELLALLRRHESPWDFEVYASIRSRLRRGEYYIAAEGAPQAFVYDWFNGGAVHRGKWTKSAVRLLQENNLPVDISVRGEDTDTVLRPEDIPQDEREKTAFGRLSIRLGVLRKHWRSLI